MKSRGDNDSWNVAKYLRNIANSKIRQAKREFVLSKLETHIDDPKKFWKTIHEVIPSKKSKLKQDILLKDKGVKIDKEKVAHFINDYFINVGKVVDPIPPTSHSLPPAVGGNSREQLQTQDEGWIFNKLLSKDIFDVVNKINTAKSSGLDQASSFVIKKAFSILITEITFMMNLSVSTSHFPDAWKEALIVPIPKVGNLNQVQNYQPISLLPLPGKVFEKLVHAQLSRYLENNNFLVPEQHGFRKSHSTIHSIEQLTSFVNSKMDSGLPTIAAFIDFRKAFDCVKHQVLLDKLNNLGLAESVVDWVTSYLMCRKVYANGCHSTFMQITQGVPQGSVLGPLFYIIYANDLSTTLTNCKIALYADDTVLYTANKNFNDSMLQLQKDMNALSAWCINNGITANTEKTKIMIFGSTTKVKDLPEVNILFDHTPIQLVSSYKYLNWIVS